VTACCRAETVSVPRFEGGRDLRVQADAPFRMVPDDFNRWYVRNSAGSMVSVASFANSHWTYGSPRLERYNGVAAGDIKGEASCACGVVLCDWIRGPALR